MIQKQTSTSFNLFNPIHLLATLFGSGLSKFAPGTMGTIVAAFFWWPLCNLPLHYRINILLTAIVVGIWLCGQTAKDIKVHDHPAIVWDELCGYWLTMLLSGAKFKLFIYGFILFRLFDIWKPWPIRWVDKHVNGGAGIVIDDLIAGFLSLIIMQITTCFF